MCLYVGWKGYVLMNDFRCIFTVSLMIFLNICILEKVLTLFRQIKGKVSGCITKCDKFNCKFELDTLAAKVLNWKRVNNILAILSNERLLWKKSLRQWNFVGPLKYFYFRKLCDNIIGIYRAFLSKGNYTRN